MRKWSVDEFGQLRQWVLMSWSVEAVGVDGLGQLRQWVLIVEGSGC